MNLNEVEYGIYSPKFSHKTFESLITLFMNIYKNQKLLVYKNQ